MPIKAKNSKTAPATETAGKKRPWEDLTAFLSRIKDTEKLIAVPHNGRLEILADLPNEAWARNVARMWQEQN